MRTRALVALGLLLVLATTTACGGDAAAVDEGQYVIALRDREDRFVTMMRDRIPVTEGLDDESLLNIGYGVCENTWQLNTPEALTDFVGGTIVGSDGDMDVADIGSILVSASVLCPPAMEPVLEMVRNY